MLRKMKIIDVHMHGIGGLDTSTIVEEHIIRMSEIQGSLGVSEILPTVYPAAIQEMRVQMAAIKKAMQIQRSSPHIHQREHNKRINARPAPSAGIYNDSFEPATISGIHLEGPFINPALCGSLNPEACITPSEYLFKELTEGFEDIIKIVTIAPEMHGATELIQKISEMGIIASMGHSDATFAEAEKGFHAGAKGITHIFNAMRCFHHRDPGIAGFGIVNQQVYIEIIADPFHLHDQTIALIFKAKSLDKIIIISDSVKQASPNTCHSGIRDQDGALLGGCMAVTESAERLIRQGYDNDVIMRCITENPRAYLS